MKASIFCSVVGTCLYAMSIPVIAQQSVTFTKTVEVKTGAWLQVEGDLCSVIFAEPYKVIDGLPRREVFQLSKPCTVLLKHEIVEKRGPNFVLAEKFNSISTAKQFQESVSEASK